MKELQVTELENINGGSWGRAVVGGLGAASCIAGAGLIIAGIATFQPECVIGGGDLIEAGAGTVVTGIGALGVASN